MIAAHELTRRYGGLVAVDALSFEVSAGEVVGFLGPNGAGKTTTLRMLAGSLAVSSGRVEIGGVDMAKEPLRAKRLLGYLPERPPLYNDMTVLDYVRYAATLHEAQHADAAEDAIARVGIADVKGRLVGHLSKGYRQRVGLAAAIAHRPRVVLLDEPASGLDPVQRVDMRALIRSLANGEATVLLSTHVLSEVADVCDRVLVIHQGALVGDHPVGGDPTTIRLRTESTDGLETALRAVEGVVEVVVGDPTLVRTDADRRAQVAAAASGFGLVEMRASDDLESVFLRLVGA